jgi:hypothetical protein
MPENKLAEFYSFVREERLFCAVLAHLLLQRGPNLGTFLQLINSKLPPGGRILTAKPEEAQIYLEFSYLRDNWDSLETNDAKRSFIFDLLGRIPELSRYKGEDFPAPVPQFNAYFMGFRGMRVLNDIVYPGQWSVRALAEKFGNNRDVFRDFCRFKWAFNIKSDMVLVLPNSPAICIEAKLESRESEYPSSHSEREIFDRIFGPGRARVGQLELQQFMFQYHLEHPCRFVVIARAPLQHQGEGREEPPYVFLSWREVLERLDTSTSLPYVEQLLKENEHLRKA